MRQNTKKKRSGFGYFIRMFLMLVELLAVVEKGVKEAIGTLIVEFGSYGKAPLVEMTGLDEMAERYRKGL